MDKTGLYFDVVGSEKKKIRLIIEGFNHFTGIQCKRMDIPIDFDFDPGDYRDCTTRLMAYFIEEDNDG